MNIIRKTLSFCPTCYRWLMAGICFKDDKVVMVKHCPEHGTFESVVENDIEYWSQAMASGATNIYNGYFLDVTRRCNLACKYCFYDVDANSEDPSIESLVVDAGICAGMAPIILTGGEPTLRPDLPQVIATLQEITPHIELLTNGTGLTGDMLDAVLPLLTADNRVARINLSIHPESEGLDMDVIEKARKRDIKLESLLFVIDDLSQIDTIIRTCNEHRDVVEAVRIKAATRLWADDGPEKKIFVSDMLKYIQQRYDAVPMWWRNNKVSFFNLQIGSIYYMLVSWYDVTNIDIVDIKCPPYYRACTGMVDNIVTSNIINEGLYRGWLNGRKVQNGQLC